MRTTRGVEVGAALAVLVACAGCTEVLGFGRFSGEGEDASAPMDGQVDLDAGGDAAADAGMDATVDERLALTVTVNGEGTVTSDPPGVDCGASCEGRFAPGTRVTLTATGTDTGIVSWGGDCGGFDETCVVTVDADRAVEADFGPRGSARWVAQISFSGADFIESDAAVTSDGHVVVAGTIDDADGTDLYVAKLDRESGAELWATRVVTSVNEFYGGLAVDAEGNVYAAATVLGFGDFMVGRTRLAADLSGNVMVLRLAAADGAIAWVRDWGGGGQDRPSGLAVDGADLYVVGETSSTSADFDGLTLSGGGSGDAFIVRAPTSTGMPARLKHLEGNLEVRAVAASGGRVGITGDFTGSATFDPGCGINWSGAMASDGFVADLRGSDLDCQWANDFGSFRDGETVLGFAIASHPDGGWVATGGFEGSVNFAGSGTSLTARDAMDAYVVRYDAGGGHVWSFRFGGTGSDLGTSIGTTPDGATLWAGAFDSAVTFGAVSLTGNRDAFVARLGPGMTPIVEWARGFGGDDPDRAEGVAVDPAGNPYVAAYFSGMTVVDGRTLAAASQDAWVAGLVR